MGIDPVTATLGAAVLGPVVGSVLGGGGGQSGSTSTGVPYYTPSGQGAADTQFQQYLTQLNNPYSSLIPSYNQYSQQDVNNPYATGAQTAANTAGAQSTAAGAGLAGLSPLYSGEAANLSPYMTQILNQGFDPQNALYAQQLQNTNDQANVTNAQYGLTGQQAAGNVNQADLNFNTNWQNQELSRALQGITGAGNVAQAQSGLSTAAGTAGTGGAGLTLAGGVTPSTQYTGNIGQILQALSGQGAFGGTANQQNLNNMASIIPYLNYGNGATNAGANASAANLAANQQSATNIGQLFSGLSGLFSSSNPFGSGFNTSSNPTGGGYNNYISQADTAQAAQNAFDNYMPGPYG